MASFSQKINNFVLGFTDQPDELKAPGQVRDAINVFPDVTFGLLKRPGFSIVGELTNSVKDGRWFSYYRTNNFTSTSGSFKFSGNTEEYMGNISKDGFLRMYNAETGEELDVEYSDTSQYDYRNPHPEPRFP